MGDCGPPPRPQEGDQELICRRKFFATTGIRQGIVWAKSKPRSVLDAYTAARYPTWVMPRAFSDERAGRPRSQVVDFIDRS
jgi:hypothetical protein